jgi:hypothetical protein
MNTLTCAVICYTKCMENSSAGEFFNISVLIKLQLTKINNDMAKQFVTGYKNVEFMKIYESQIISRFLPIYSDGFVDLGTQYLMEIMRCCKLVNSSVIQKDVANLIGIDTFDYDKIVRKMVSGFEMSIQKIMMSHMGLIKKELLSLFLTFDNFDNLKIQKNYKVEDPLYELLLCRFKLVYSGLYVGDSLENIVNLIKCPTLLPSELKEIAQIVRFKDVQTLTLNGSTNSRYLLTMAAQNYKSIIDKFNLITLAEVKDNTIYDVVLRSNKLKTVFTAVEAIHMGIRYSGCTICETKSLCNSVSIVFMDNESKQFGNICDKLVDSESEWPFLMKGPENSFTLTFHIHCLKRMKYNNLVCEGKMYQKTYKCFTTNPLIDKILCLKSDIVSNYICSK